MRIWTLHPKYLDAQGLVAVWRETLLAQKVLQGATKGYKNHPQLERFKEQRDPVASVAAYLCGIFAEAQGRGYQFNEAKIAAQRDGGKITTARGQLLYEWEHLRKKLRTRDPKRFRELRSVEAPEPHPLFRIVPGGVESWEILGGKV